MRCPARGEGLNGGGANEYPPGQGRSGVMSERRTPRADLLPSRTMPTERDGFEAARRQRSGLERLMSAIPGFRGFSDRELRRAVDKLQRDHVAGELGRLKDRTRELARRLADAGDLEALAPFERLDRRLDALAQAVRFADYGASGLFDTVKIREPELERLYRFDLSILDGLARLEAELAAVPAPGAGDPEPALERLLATLAELDDQWRRRPTVISDVVKG